ncbi:MAG: hypothetical protein WCI73_14005, partial [Phycisphaerae bacterium]
STPSYRAQQFTMLSEVMKGMNPELQAAIAPFWMEASDLQHRKQMADQMRKALGQPVEPSSPEEAQAQAQAQQAQAEVAAVQKQMALAELGKRQAEVKKLEAEAQKIMAEAGGNPELAGHQAEAQAAIAEAKAEAKEEIDSMTVEIMTLRNTNALKEQQLREQLAKAQAAATNAQTKADAEDRRAMIERDIAEMTNAANVRIAELESARNGAGEKMMAAVDKKIEALVKSIEAVKQAQAKPVKAEAREPKPVAAPPVNVEVKIEAGAIQVGGGSKSITITKNADGSMTGKSQEDKK